MHCFLDRILCTLSRIQCSMIIIFIHTGKQKKFFPLIANSLYWGSLEVNQQYLQDMPVWVISFS